MRFLARALAVVLLAPPAGAGEVELLAQLGRALPYYDQALRHATNLAPLPGFALSLDDAIGLDARGGRALSASLTGYVAGGLGFEARADRVGVRVDVRDARFTLLLRAGGPVPPQIASFDAKGRVRLDPLTPFSLNLKLRFGGALRLALSGGASYLPSFGFLATETIATRPLGIPGLEAPSLGLAAGGTLDGGVGWNGGVAVELGVGAHAALVGELRAFVFPERELAWRAADDRPLTGLEQALLAEAIRTLDPVRFRPGFYQATAGVALRF